MPGFARLYVSLLLGRMAGSMLAIALILFVLARYHSPALAGITAFLAVFPGLVVSPVAGALLDRYGRARLILVDYLIAALAVCLIAILSARQSLPPPLLLVIAAISSLTNPLSSTGVRSLFPIVAPRHLWERANALDSSGYLISSLIGAPLAGSLISWIGPEPTLAAIGVVFAVAALSMFQVHDPSIRTTEGDSILMDAWRGFLYVVRGNPTLRGLALSLSTYNVSWGILEIAIPVLVLGRLHQGPATVGFLWGSMGAAGLVSALFAGRIRSQGRERQMIFVSLLIGAAAMALLPFAGSLAIVASAVIAVGAANGPFDIGLFTLRQRRTDPAWFGRAFAVSMSLNFAGMPIGSAIAGPIIEWSLNAALWVAVGVAAIATLIPLLAIPAEEPGQRMER